MSNLFENIDLPPFAKGSINSSGIFEPVKGYVDQNGLVFSNDGTPLINPFGGGEKQYKIDPTPQKNELGETIYSDPTGLLSVNTRTGSRYNFLNSTGTGTIGPNSSQELIATKIAEKKEENLFKQGFRRENASPTGYVIGGSARDGSGTPVMPDGSPWTGQSMIGVATDPQKAAQLLQQIQQEYVNQSFGKAPVGGAQAEKVSALQNEFTSLFPDFNVAQGVLNSGYKQQQTAIDKYFEEQKNTGSGLSPGNILKTVGDLTVKVGPAIAAVALAAHGIPALLSSIAPAAGAAGGAAAGGAAAGSGLSAAELLAVGGFTPTAGSAASFAAPSLLGSATLAGGTGLTGGAGGSTGLLGGTSAAGLSGAGSASGITATQAAAGLGVSSGSALPVLGMATGALPSTVGTLSAALPAQGSVGGAGAMSSQLAPGTILGSGLPGGGSIGASYALGANGLPATSLLGTPIPASSIGISNIPETVTAGLNLSPKDILDVARIGSQVLGGQPQQPTTPVAKPQSIIPRGQVDYSGILNLLQSRSPQRNIYSLLG
jgi:hypothetical protein